LTITGAELQLSRYTDGCLLEALSFPQCFVYVDIERDNERDLIGRLLLRSKGKAYEIGSFLGAQERLALERALQRALARSKI
jgi:uncharacterized membrane protein